jgi:hypothetical protein
MAEENNLNSIPGEGNEGGSESTGGQQTTSSSQDGVTSYVMDISRRNACGLQPFS